MKRVSKRLHLWLAIPSGVFITLICLTGAIMVFQTQIEELFNKDRYFTLSNAPTMQLDSLVERVNNQLMADTVVALKIYSDPKRNIVATLSSGARVNAYIDPATAKVVEVKNSREGFFHNVMTLHRWLMLKNRTLGKVIIGVSTIFLIVVLLTGLIRWIPRKRSSIILKWRGANSFRRVFDLHKIIGVYAALLLLVMAFTGLMWSFDWYRGAVAKMLNVEMAEKRSNKPYFNRKPSNVQLFWQPAFDQITDINSAYQSVTISKSGDISFLSQYAAHHRAADKYRFDAKDQSVHFVSKYNNGSLGYMMSQNYAIHVGSWGGLPTQILWFVAVLMGALLPITGYILFLYHRK